jgi:ketosteroid isomerase-like protein
MSQGNVELVREALNVFAQVDEGLADPQRLTEFFAPDGTWDLGAFSALVAGREIRNVDDFLEFRAAWMEPYDDYSYEVEEILDAGGNQVVVTLYQRGKPRGSDSWIDSRYGFVYTIEGGLIQRAQVYASANEALEAAGLR